MENFEFYNPTHIVFGKNSIQSLADLIPAKKILLVYGEGSVKKNGVYDQVKKRLSHFEIVDFSGIKPNPDYEKAMEAVELIRREKIEFILALGGGSVIDAVKFISAAVHFSGTPSDILTRADSPILKAVPFGVVLTLAATGSEMNCFSVISYKDSKLSFASPLVYPKFSLLDPTYTYSLNERQIGNGVVDAYIHVLEQYLTFPVNAPLQDRMCESILQTLLEVGPVAFQNKNDYEARANFMWCASMALNSLCGLGMPQDWSTHRIGHELTALYGIDHARTLALVWAKNMRARRANKKDKMIQYAERVLGIKNQDPDKTFDEALLATNHFFESLGVPTDMSAYPEITNETGGIISARLKKRGIVILGEKSDINLNIVSTIMSI